MSDTPNKAGGFASLRSTVNQLIKSKRIRENIKNLYKMNKHEGFDCPGCAWGDEKTGTFKFCENGAKAVAWESTDKLVGDIFFEQHSVSSLRKKSGYWLELQGRLEKPMRYIASLDRYQAIDWDDAFALIRDRLVQLEHPDQLELYTSGRASNEASFLYQLFGRKFGTNNFPDCSNMCHEASGIAMTEALGVGKGTVTLEDFDNADCLLIFGQNPGSNHPRMLNTLRKAAKRGAQIITFNNLQEIGLRQFASPQDPKELLTPASTKISTQYYTPKLGGDYAVARGIAKAIFEDFTTSIDSDFINANCVQFEEYKNTVEQETWSHICSMSGLSQAQFMSIAQTLSLSENVISTWAMGITQHYYSVQTIRELINLNLLLGAVGKTGSGLCPVRGHSNVQGNRTMGILEAPSPAFNAQLREVFAFEPPTQTGHKTGEAIDALYREESKILISLGGNIAAAASDTDYTQSALSKAEFSVHIATKLNKSHLYIGKDALILPCLGRTEQDMQASGNQMVTVEDTFSMVHASVGASTPASSYLKSETEIIARIAHAVFANDKDIDWLGLIDDYDHIRALIAKTIPGFEEFNRAIRQVGGFYLGNAAKQRVWNNKQSKAVFSSQALPTSIFMPSVATHIEQTEQAVFVMQSMRSHDQYNTTVYGMNDRYRGIAGERNIVFMHADDIAMLGLSENELVDVRSIWTDDKIRKVQGFKVVSYHIPRGDVAMYYPEANALIPAASNGELSRTPTSKSVPVIILKSTSTIHTQSV